MAEGKCRAEEAVMKWLSERGYDYRVRTYTPDAPKADAVKIEKDTISIPEGVEDVEAFMRQFEKSFESIKETTAMCIMARQL